MRLVPNQNAAQICELFKSFIQSIAPPGIKVTIQEFHSNDPVLVSRDQASVQAAARAIEIGFGKAPVFTGREAGTAWLVNSAEAHRLFGRPANQQLRIVGEQERRSLVPEWL